MSTQTLAELPRVAANALRDREAAKHFALMIEHLGRALAALDAGRWDGARDHLASLREESAIADVYLNSGQPDPAAFVAAVRAQIPQEWATAIRLALESEAVR
ncbi:hypothetical protein ACFYY8_33745 [Streptosporangium sp. NPDC001559]|uniref:hypothetical protein n=1 Tax=Streptosporangium sp. NPDC001559 TaxID=3366187 RepID=UPI0036E5CF4D